MLIILFQTEYNHPFPAAVFYLVRTLVDVQRRCVYLSDHIIEVVRHFHERYAHVADLALFACTS